MTAKVQIIINIKKYLIILVPTILGLKNDLLSERT